MGSLSAVHWLLIVIWGILIGLPVAKIISKAGYSKWWAIISIFPLVNLVGLWVFAFSKWPSLVNASSKD
jgi:hypothetical protein